MNNAYAAGKQLLRGGYTQYTVYGKSNFVKNGKYSKIPQAGSIVYFFSKKKGRVAHVEIVTHVSYNPLNKKYTIKHVGGNTSGNAVTRNGGQVAEHTTTFSLSEVGGRNHINGFGMPLFDDTTCDVNTFLKVVKGEVGYLEKASNKDLHHKTANAGFNNYTKYGEWYGCNGVYWCQQFVSWCAYEACRRYLANKKTEWFKLDDGNWQYRLNGNIVKGQWLEIGGRWYVFDEAGNAVAGWFKSEGDWYYLNPADNTMLSGQWIDLDGKEYYLTKAGVMATSAYVKHKGKYFWVNEAGELEYKWTTSNPDLAKYDLAE